MYGDIKKALERMKGMKKRDKMQDVIPKKAVGRALEKVKMGSKGC